MGALGGVDESGKPFGSLNHYSKGAVLSFLHRYVAGLRPTTSGYATFEVRPRLGGGLTWCRLRHDSPRGPISVDWELDDELFELSVTVPPGSEAAVVMPDGTRHSATAGSHMWCSPVGER